MRCSVAVGSLVSLFLSVSCSVRPNEVRVHRPFRGVTPTAAPGGPSLGTEGVEAGAAGLLAVRWTDVAPLAHEKALKEAPRSCATWAQAQPIREGFGYVGSSPEVILLAETQPAANPGHPGTVTTLIATYGVQCTQLIAPIVGI